LHTSHRIVLHSVLVAQMVKQRRHGRELPPNRCRCELLSLELLAPGDDVGASDHPQLGRRLDATERHEGLDVALVSPASVRVVDVPEPDHGRWHVGELMELLCREHSVARFLGRDCVVLRLLVHGPPPALLILIMYFITNSSRQMGDCKVRYQGQFRASRDPVANLDKIDKLCGLRYPGRTTSNLGGPP